MDRHPPAAGTLRAAAPRARARRGIAILGLALTALGAAWCIGLPTSRAGPLTAAAAPPVATPPPPPAPTPAPRGGPTLLSDPQASPLLDRHYRSSPRPAPRPPDPEQEVEAQRFRILAATGVGPGMRVADFSVGRGLITALFARAVGPEGLVYGVGSAPDLPEVLRRLAREYHVTNLVPVASIGEDAVLPKAGVDLAFVGGDLRQFTDPGALFAAIHRALIPYGTLVIVAPRAPGGARRPGAPRAPTRDVLLDLARQTGFKLIEETDILPETAFLRLERGAEGTAADAGEPGDTDTPAPAPPTPLPAGSAPAGPAVGTPGPAPAAGARP